MEADSANEIAQLNSRLSQSTSLESALKLDIERLEQQLQSTKNSNVEMTEKLVVEVRRCYDSEQLARVCCSRLFV